MNGWVYLGGETLIGSVRQEEAYDGVVVLLRRHVKWSEPILRLDVDGGAV